MEENEILEDGCMPLAPVAERAPSHPIIWGITFVFGLMVWIGLGVLLWLSQESYSHIGETFFILSTPLSLPFVIITALGSWRHVRQKNGAATYSQRKLSTPKRALVGDVLLYQFLILLMTMLPLFSDDPSPMFSAILLTFILYLFLATTFWLLPEEVQLIKRFRLSGRMRLILAAVYSLFVHLVFMFCLAFLLGMADFMASLPYPN